MNASPPNKLLRQNSTPNHRNQLWIPPPSQNMIPLGQKSSYIPTHFSHDIANLLTTKHSKPSSNHQPTTILSSLSQHREDILFLCSTIPYGSSPQSLKDLLHFRFMQKESKAIGFLLVIKWRRKHLDKRVNSNKN